MKKIYIVYGSQTGNAEEISNEIYELFVEKGYSCQHMPLNRTVEKDSFSFLEHPATSIVVIVCSTTGNGDAPENANQFWRKIKNMKLPTDLLNGIEYAVLGLGDTNYDKFCQMGKNLDRRFNQLGGKRLFELHCADEVEGLEPTVKKFIERLCSTLLQISSA